MPSSAEVRKWLEHTNKQGWIIDHKRDWLTDLQVLTTSRDQFGSVPEKAALFWIRLHGVVGDLRDEAQEHFATMRKMAEDYPEAIASDGKFNQTYKLMESVVRAHDALRGAIDEPEAVLLDFMRHLQAHPMVDSYRYQWRAKGSGLQTDYRPRLLGKSYDREALLQIIVQELEEHGGEAGAANALASKIAPLVLAVWTTSAPLFQPD